jgi:hypothetical protein
MLGPEVRITRDLRKEVMTDLMRPHEFAEERVGFLFGKFVGGSPGLVLLSRYTPVPDERYEPSEEFGALINSEAILATMQRLRDRRGTFECAFHVHMHGHKGAPRLSGPDKRSLPKLIPGFQRMSPDGAHGILVFSLNHGRAWVWTSGEGEPCLASRISVIGAPLEFFSTNEVERL